MVWKSVFPNAKKGSLTIVTIIAAKTLKSMQGIEFYSIIKYFEW